MTRTVLLLLCLVSAVPASAQSGRRGTQSEQQACEPDATRLCRAVINSGEFAILRCLQENRPRLRKACRAVLERKGV